jgi:hypothetical protein
MVNCECLKACPFYNDRMANTLTTAEIYKKKFCLGDRANCARYFVFEALGKPSIPSDLYPNQMERAKRILASTPKS